MHFAQRNPNLREAGREIAERLARFSRSRDAVILALPNGGASVGAEIARSLGIPADVLVVGKITAHGCGGMPIGAITCGGVRLLNHAMIERLNLSRPEVNAAVLRGALRQARREKLCRGRKPGVEVEDRTVILVDDGSTPCIVLRDAIRLLRRRHVERVVLAMPSACRHHAGELRMEADEFVTLDEPAMNRRPCRAGHSPRNTPPSPPSGPPVIE
jgi:predicted phosphoribosyltransferase